jgi:hypothetical protein
MIEGAGAGSVPRINRSGFREAQMHMDPPDQLQRFFFQGTARAATQGQRHLPVRGLQQGLQEREEPAPPLQGSPRESLARRGEYRTRIFKRLWSPGIDSKE